MYKCIPDNMCDNIIPDNTCESIWDVGFGKVCSNRIATNRYGVEFELALSVQVFFMMQIWNCLEVCYIAPTVFTSYSLPHWNLCQWNSALLTALLLCPTVTITSTNIHLFYHVFLMEHINCYCVVAWPAIHCYSFFMYFLFYFNNFFSFLMLYYSYTQTFSRILLYCWYRYCVLFCALLDGACLSGNKSITYLLVVFPIITAYEPQYHARCGQHQKVQNPSARSSVQDDPDLSVDCSQRSHSNLTSSECVCEHAQKQ